MTYPLFRGRSPKVSGRAPAYYATVVGRAETAVQPAAEELTTAEAAAELSVEDVGVLALPGEAAATRTKRANRDVSPEAPPLEKSAPETACSIEAFFARWRFAAKGVTRPM